MTLKSSIYMFRTFFLEWSNPNRWQRVILLSEMEQRLKGVANNNF